MRGYPAVFVIAILLLGAPAPTQAYSVLAHEAIIDSAWDAAIKPLLLKRFPNSTPDELRMAHAYAYGGSIIQDLGYYPFGSKFFSDLVHYVRSGDFIEALLRDSQDINEYAFALGALSHYAADNNGHRLAVNRAVPLLYPKLQRKYGDTVTYAEDPAAHLKTEFGFDVVQVARGAYAPDGYHDFIGFQVAKPLLERAFQDTYSVPLQSVFDDLDRAIGSYRWSVSSVIPKMTKVAWQLKSDDIQKLTPGMTRTKFQYHISRRAYEKEWNKNYRKPGFGTKLLAFIIRIIPKVGPFQALQFRTPTPEVEKMFLTSFDVALEDYRKLLGEVRDNNLQIENANFDVGEVTTAGQYTLEDSAYANLLHHMAANDFKQVSPSLRADIIRFYGNLNAPFETKRRRKEWAEVIKELDELKASTAAPSRAGAQPEEAKPAADAPPKTKPAGRPTP